MVMRGTIGIIIQTDIPIPISGSIREEKMLLVIMFDRDADIVNVPQSVIDNKDRLRKKFLRWIYSKNSLKCQNVIPDMKGKNIHGVKYRGDIFVEWLNEKVLCNSDEKATVLRQQVLDYPNDVPILFF